jgi:hypothetical protein
MQDVLDCGQPEAVWAATVAYLEARARQSEDIAEELRKDAQDALEQADGHFAAAQELHSLALAMKRAPVTFAASVDTHPKGGDVKQAPSPMGGAVGAAETLNPHDQNTREASDE